MMKYLEIARLVDVIKDGEYRLTKKQLPLAIDDKLTMVMDLYEMDFVCETPELAGKDKEQFSRKLSLISIKELKETLWINHKELTDKVGHIIPCIGCRKSVERLFQNMRSVAGDTGLFPLSIKTDGTVSFSDYVYKRPHLVGTIFHNHAGRLNDLSTVWDRLKKSTRCGMHSLDAQRNVRPPLNSGWRSLWDCMSTKCKKEIATIETTLLQRTLDTYLHKHRFCGECRTKVLKAYNLLINDKNKSMESNDGEGDDQGCYDDCITEDEMEYDEEEGEGMEDEHDDQEEGVEDEDEDGADYRSDDGYNGHCNSSCASTCGSSCDSSSGESLEEGEYRRGRRGKKLKKRKGGGSICGGSHKGGRNRVSQEGHGHGGGGCCGGHQDCGDGGEVAEDEEIPAGFVPELYAPLRHCFHLQHVHVSPDDGDYISKLIHSAEPELLGNTRERHAKTIEIAQEEVLICVGLCLYEKIHRVQLRLREEIAACQMLSLAAINSLSAKFQMMVEKKQGISQLELLYQELSREDELKQYRQMIKKRKKRMKKQKKLQAHEEEEDESEEDIPVVKDCRKKKRENGGVFGQPSVPVGAINRKADKIIVNNVDGKANVKNTCPVVGNVLEKGKPGGKCHSKGKEGNKKQFKESRKKDDNYKKVDEAIRKEKPNKCKDKNNKKKANKKDLAMISKSVGNKDDDDCKKFKGKEENNGRKGKNLVKSGEKVRDGSGKRCGMQINNQDCGYSSADNNVGTGSSLNSSQNSHRSDSSPDSSEIACSEGFCNHEGLEECCSEVCASSRTTLCEELLKEEKKLRSLVVDLREEVEDSRQHLGFEFVIPTEEVVLYKSHIGNIQEQRLELRKALKSRFDQICMR